MDPSGFEPEASSLQGRRSIAHTKPNQNFAFQAELRAHNYYSMSSKDIWKKSFNEKCNKKIGGDPSAGSPTDTL